MYIVHVVNRQKENRERSHTINKIKLHNSLSGLEKYSLIFSKQPQCTYVCIHVHMSTCGTSAINHIHIVYTHTLRNKDMGPFSVQRRRREANSVVYSHGLEWKGEQRADTSR